MFDEGPFFIQILPDVNANWFSSDFIVKDCVLRTASMSTADTWSDTEWASNPVGGLWTTVRYRGSAKSGRTDAPAQATSSPMTGANPQDDFRVLSAPPPSLRIGSASRSWIPSRARRVDDENAHTEVRVDRIPGYLLLRDDRCHYRPRKSPGCGELGPVVRTFHPGGSGPQTTRWDGRDDEGRLVGSGVYFYRLDPGAESSAGRLLVVR